MFGIGMPELIVILVIILIVFGAGRLPEIGSGIGKGIRNFKKAVTGEDDSTEKLNAPGTDNLGKLEENKLEGIDKHTGIKEEYKEKK